MRSTSILRPICCVFQLSKQTKITSYPGRYPTELKTPHRESKTHKIRLDVYLLKIAFLITAITSGAKLKALSKSNARS